MNRTLQIALALFSLAFFAFLLRGIFAGPEGRIRQQLEALEELVSFEAGESDLSALTKAKRLGSLFSEEVEISIQVAGFGRRSLTGREQIQGAAIAARRQTSNLQASLIDIEIEVSDDKQSALVEATGRAKVSGEQNSAMEDFVFHFVSTEDGWLIHKVETIQALR